MRREHLPITALPAWALLNNADLRGVEVRKLGNGSGCGIVSTTAVTESGTEFVVIPSELVLNTELVWLYAKNDPHLRSILEANREFVKDPRGAIMIFLIMQITYSSPDIPVKIGVSTPWTQYVKFIPDERSLPTFWTQSESQCLWGTSLEYHLKAKLSRLDREFTHFRERTQSIGWCRHWWDTETGCLSIEDWKIADAMYRSRVMDFEEYGHCLVPVMDMANHNSALAYKASYMIDERTRNARLALEHERSVKVGDEITILYGEDRSAADSLFSYGFVEKGLKNVQSVFLGMVPPEDDPLAFAKMTALDIIPGIRVNIKKTPGEVEWSGPFVWAMCINEEDGLKLEVVKRTDGAEELRATWKDEEIIGQEDLRDLLEADMRWPLFQLRAFSIVQGRLEEEIQRCEELGSRPDAEKIPDGVDPKTSVPWKVAAELRDREMGLLHKAVSQFGETILGLYGRDEVKRYLDGEQPLCYNEGSAAVSRDNLGNAWRDGEDGWASPRFKAALEELSDPASSESESNAGPVTNEIGGPATTNKATTPNAEGSESKEFS